MEHTVIQLEDHDEPHLRVIGWTTNPFRRSAAGPRSCRWTVALDRRSHMPLKGRFLAVSTWVQREPGHGHWRRIEHRTSDFAAELFREVSQNLPAMLQRFAASACPISVGGS